MESFWASISFILGVAVTQPIYVTVSDVFGRKQPLYASILLFTIGSIIFAVARNMAILIVGRLVQGLGAGGLDVLEEIILADITSLKERPLYLGLIAVFIATGSILGPVLGALFSEFVDWRWIGWINLPIVGTALVLAFFFLRLRPIPGKTRDKLSRLDWVGIILFTIGAPVTALPLSWAGALYSWSSWRTLLPFLTGLVVLIAFGFYEKRPENPVLPYRLFSNVTAIFSFIAGLIHGLMLYTILLYLPLFFEAVFLESSLEAAKSTLPMCCLCVASSFISPAIIEVTRRYRALLLGGWILTTVFQALWCIVGPATSRAATYTFEALLGVGVGIVFTGNQIPVQASVTDVDSTGLAVGMLVVFRLVGGLVGLSISSTAFSSVFQSSIAAIKPLPQGLAILEDPAQAVGFIAVLRTLDLPGESMSNVVDAYQKAFRAVWIVLTCFSFIGLCCSLFIKDLTLENEEVGRQHFVAPA